MRNPFIYPTKKNMFLLFLVMQIIPITNYLFFRQEQILSTFFATLLMFMIALCLWQTKPDKEKDERELNVELKWKGRMLESSSISMLFPLFFLAIDPSIGGWYIVMLIGVPSCLCLCIFTVLMKRELGNMFYQTEEAT